MEKHHIILSIFETSMAAGVILLLALPLISAVLTSLIPHRKRVDAGFFATTAHGIGLLFGIIIAILWWGNEAVIIQVPWLILGESSLHLNLDISFMIDKVSILMSLLVYLVSFIVQLFSVYYMRGDSGYRRYFVYLGLFTFSMLGIVLSGNLLFTFMCWELVGFSSYLLIGFWFEKPAAAYAGRKAFIVNRIGDLGFVIALMIIWSGFGTFELFEIEALIAVDPSQGMPAIPGFSYTWIIIAGFGLFAGAIGKSAQFPLLVWLPDAMEGPTPVSALIHAATMVAAGIYMLFRVFVILAVPVLDVIAVVGTLTAFMAAVAALTQNDIKKVLAFSTISQLGFMMMGIGVGVRESALLHLFTHAFFKAGLFLAAGVIIKSLHDKIHELDIPFDQINAQDMRYMGGLRKSLPWVFYCFLVFSAALIGFPFFSGFLSKDAIISGALSWGMNYGGLYLLVPIFALFTAFLTVVYISRTVVMTFFGKNRAGIDEFNGGKISGQYLIPFFSLAFLSILSLGIAFSVNPFSTEASWVYHAVKLPSMGQSLTGSLELNKTMNALSTHNHLMSSLLSLVVIAAGLLLAYGMIKKESKYFITGEGEAPGGFLGQLSYHSWFLDRLYDRFLVNPFNRMAIFSQWVDIKVIDKIVNGIGVWHVVLANIIGWIDRRIVDGVVNLSAVLARMIGGVFRILHHGTIQRYYIWVIFVILAVIIFWVV